MPYRKETFLIRNEKGEVTYSEESKYYTLRLGGKKTRVRNMNETPGWMKTANQKRREKKLRRLIQTNFTRDDIYLTLTYAEEPDYETGKKKIQKFLRTLRRKYQKKGWELKYIYRTEYKGHRLHHHLIINDPTHGSVRRKDIQDIWKEGAINHYSFQRYDGGHEDAKRLSAYFCKESKNAKCRNAKRRNPGTRPGTSKSPKSITEQSVRRSGKRSRKRRKAWNSLK